MAATLEEATEFPVVTLNDLLEADARQGAAAGAVDDRYRKWFFVSSAAAVIFFLMAVVAFATGGGDDGGGGQTQTIDPPAGTVPVQLSSVKPAVIGEDVMVGDVFKIYSAKDERVLAKRATVTSLSEDKDPFIDETIFNVRVHVAREEETALSTAKVSDLRFLAPDPPAEPAAEAPAKTPADPATEAPADPAAEVTPEAPVPVDETPPAEAPAG